MSPDELASDSVYFSLFRLVEIAELQDAEAAVKWAELVLSSKEMREGLVKRVKEREQRPIPESPLRRRRQG